MLLSSSSRASGAPGSRAFSALTTAGSAAYSTAMALTASWASARLWATTAATGAPAACTAPRANRGWRDLHAWHQWQHWHVQALAQVVTGHDGDYVGQRLRRTRLHGDDCGMRVWAAQEGHVQHARQLHVVHVTALAGD